MKNFLIFATCCAVTLAGPARLATTDTTSTTHDENNDKYEPISVEPEIIEDGYESISIGPDIIEDADKAISLNPLILYLVRSPLVHVTINFNNGFKHPLGTRPIIPRPLVPPTPVIVVDKPKPPEEPILVATINPPPVAVNIPDILN